MCKPTILRNEDRLQEKEYLPPSKEQEHRGFLYGTLSLALTVTAGSVVMGHYQSKRDDLGCDTMCVGSMTSARSALALVGSTIIGKASDSRSLDDQLGGTRRAFLVFGVLAAATELMLATQASSISMLWMSLIPSALFQQNFTVLKALFGQYHDESPPDWKDCWDWNCYCPRY